MDAWWKEPRMDALARAAGATEQQAADRRMWTRQANRQENRFTHIAL